MRLVGPTRRDHRCGKILVFFCFLLTVLFGMLGVVIDGGLMMASHRQVQNAADSAALAAAMELMRGGNATSATTEATTFVQSHNGLADATVTVNIPPSTGPHAGDGQFVEVIVSHPYDTVFAQFNGADSNQTIAARAVAGYEPVSSGEGAIVLDPRGDTAGITFNGVNTQLKVDGTVVVNAGGSGFNQYGTAATSDLGTTRQPAVVTSNVAVSDKTRAYVLATSVQVRGGVDTPGNFANIDNPVSGANPLYAGVGMSPDPLRLLAVPAVSNTYVSPTSTTATGTIPARYPPQSVGNGQTVTFNPGVYEDINITGGDVTFASGIYVFSPTRNNQGLRMSGGQITSAGWTSASSPGNGVMFYFAASNYLDTPGSPGAADIADGHFDGPLPPTNGSYTLATDSNQTKVAQLSVAGNFNGTSEWVRLAGYAYNPDRTDDRILFFGRRKTQTTYAIGGNGTQINNTGLEFKGTIYAKWSQFDIGGGGNYDAQFIVGRLGLGGGATMTLKATGVNRGLANQVFLVE